jgi:uncharacterized protein (TIGR03435 family)
MRYPRIAKGVLLAAVAATPVASQTSAAQKLSFGVTSVKPNKSGSGSSRSGIRPNGYFFATNVSLKSLIVQAYGILGFQVSGGPSWVDADRFDVEARAEPGAITAATGPPTPNQPDTILLMIQSLLEDRFQLTLRKETREAPVLALVVEKGGVKLQPSPQRPPGPDGITPASIRMSPLSGQPGLEIVGSGMNIDGLAHMLAAQVGRTVIDKTGLKGTFDFSLKVIRQASVPAPVIGGGQQVPPASDPVSQVSSDMASALQEQLGLRLDSIRAPVEFYIIDSVLRPSEN